MLQPHRKAKLAVAVASLCCATLTPDVMAEEISADPQVSFSYVELPKTIKQLRFVFACQDGQEIETRWIAENVGDAAPPNSLIARTSMVTHGPLNVAQLTRPTNGWPLGLYRLELWRHHKPFHAVHFVIEDLDARSE